MAAKDSVERMEAAGDLCMTRAARQLVSIDMTIMILTLKGTGLPDNFAADGQLFANFADGHHRQLPRLVKGPLNTRRMHLKISKIYTLRLASYEAAVIAPSMMYLLYPLQRELEGYS
ncbi:hypothetical protein HDV64DRAFT_96529 [Trichoderma sp. TUCIM 5745]